MIDLRGDSETSYIADEIIIGDFYDIGYVVVRGVRIDNFVDDAIHAIAKMTNWKGKWWNPWTNGEFFLPDQ